MLFGRQHNVALLGVRLSVKSGVVGANDNELFCFEHTERSIYHFLIKSIDSDSNGGIFTLIQPIFNNSNV